MSIHYAADLPGQPSASLTAAILKNLKKPDHSSARLHRQLAYPYAGTCAPSISLPLALATRREVERHCFESHYHNMIFKPRQRNIKPYFFCFFRLLALLPRSCAPWRPPPRSSPIRDGGRHPCRSWHTFLALSGSFAGTPPSYWTSPPLPTMRRDTMRRAADMIFGNRSRTSARNANNARFILEKGNDRS